MSTSTIPSVLPAQEPFIANAVPIPGPARLARHRSRPVRFLLFCWRFAVGAFLCMNFLSSVLVVGWLYRRMQGLVLRGWWKGSRLGRVGSFEDFCTRLGPAVPTTRPRWFLQEGAGLALRRPTSRGRKPGALRLLCRAFLVPWHSLWLNLRTGSLALFCTFLLTGWGCLLMTFSWEFGWLNSFHKGYELAYFGPLLGIAGILLFVASMLYVPMAQVHLAVTDDPRAFFDFPTIWRLIQTRPLLYVGLASFIGLISLPLEVFRVLPYTFDQIFPHLESASNAEVLEFFQRYRFACAAFLFAGLLGLQRFSAMVYRSAMTRALARGWISGNDLHPTLRTWLTQLELCPRTPLHPEPFKGGMGSLSWWVLGSLHLLIFGIAVILLFTAGPQAALVALAIWIGLWAVLGVAFLIFRRGLRQYVRFNAWQFALGALFWIWFLFVAKVYVSEFFHYHPVIGFMNHALIQLPCLDGVPGHLRE